MSKTAKAPKKEKKSAKSSINKKRFEKALPKGFKLTANSETIYNSKQQDPAFYATGDSWTIATVSYKGEEFGIRVVGEMRIELEDNTIRTVSDLEEAGITTDKQLGKLDQSVWENNSWFKIFDFHNTDSSNFDDVADSIEEAVAWCVEAIKDKRKSKK